MNLKINGFNQYNSPYFKGAFKIDDERIICSADINPKCKLNNGFKDLLQSAPTTFNAKDPQTGSLYLICEDRHNTNFNDFFFKNEVKSAFCCKDAWNQLDNKYKLSVFHPEYMVELDEKIKLVNSMVNYDSIKYRKLHSLHVKVTHVIEERNLLNAEKIIELGRNIFRGIKTSI